MTPDDLEVELLELAGRVRAIEESADPETLTWIRETLERLVDGQSGKPRVFHWDDLDPEDAQAAWLGLLGWVQNVLSARYPRANATVRDCWWQHLDARDAVTAAWFAWIDAYRNSDSKGDAPAVWQATHLPNLLTQLRDALDSCDNGHFPNRSVCQAMRTIPTDYSTISVRPSDQ